MHRINRGHAPTINMLLYADPGVGKTRAAASLAYHPLTREVLFLNVEGGLSTVEEMDIPDDQMPYNEPLRYINELESTAIAIAQRHEKYRHVKTVVLDSGTELQQRGLENYVEGKMDQESKRGANDKRAKHEDVSEFWQEDYGRVGRALIRAVRLMREAPVNFIITAHVARTYQQPSNTRQQVADADKVITEAAPSFTASPRRHICGYMDYVWYMYEEEGKRNILTQKAGVYYAKTRGEKLAKKLGPLIENVDDKTLPRIYEELRTIAGSNGEEA